MAEPSVVIIKKVPDPEKQKPPYLLGLLGILPLFGFFVGLGLTLYGIIKYKDHKLIIIGIACMLFSVLVYASLYYYSISDHAKQGSAQLGQMELNGLIKNIEFYKLENGAYPDSLQQLHENDDIVFDTDPFGTLQHPLFNYQNLGEHYLLYSSGIDKVPHTADDIYPEIQNPKATGWIRGE